MTYTDFIRDPQRGCAIAAHRGAWHGAPENSLAAIQRAIDLGADIVELDVRQSADGVLFLMHDDTLARVAGIDADPRTLSMAQLKTVALRADDGGPDRAGTDERIPTLDEALDLIRGRIFADLDLKDRSLFAQVAQAAARIKAQDHVDLKTEIGGRSDLDWVARQNIGGVAFMPMTGLTADTIDARLSDLATIAPFMTEIRFDHLDTIARNRDRFAAAGWSLWKNTLDQASSGIWTDAAAMTDPDAVWGRLIDAGISVIQTDHPQALRTYLRARAA